MKKFLKCRVLPVILAFSCLISLLVVPTFAVDFPSEFRDYDAVDDWNAKLLTSNSMGLNALAQATGFPATANEIFWGLVNGQVSNKAGEVNRSELEILASSYTAFFTSTIGETFGEQIKNSFGDVFNDMLARTLIGNWDPYFEVHQHPSSGLYRIKEMTTGLFVVDSAGRYPYAEASSDGFLGTDQWVPISAMDGGSFRMLSKEALYNLADDVGGTAYTRGNYICIAKNASSGVVDKMVLANEDGKPYVCWKDKNQSATEQERPTTNVTENGNIVEGDDNSVNLDLEGMTMLLPGGTLAFIDQIIYDESTKSYHIDSHDTYNTTINNYYTWNYYINYTSITYIGQTEEYNKYYEVYYELPDGRDSADLTKEDLEQLNLSIDVIPYVRSADDTSLRSLYHFDGDVKDSSYWNYCTEFTWNKGASLTYMDASTFGGALYLDEKQHDFTFTLPSSIGTSDLTLQFRYYQSATLAPQTDTTLYFGNTSFAKMNGSYLLDGGGSKQICEIPIGTWNEICFMRKDGKYCWYLNGVVCTQGNWATSLSNSVRFSFGDQQQTFKYFDEFRFVDEAVYELGKNYEVSSVPHDTNLTLVLPDSQVPVADEYWSFENPNQTNLLSQYGLDKWAGFTSSSKLNQCTTLTTYDSSNYGYTSAPYRIGSDIRDFPRFTYYSNLTNFNVSQSGLNMTFNASNGLIANSDYAVVGNTGYSSNYFAAGPTGGLFTVLGSSNTNQNVDAHTVPKSDAVWCSDLPAGDYTFSLVNSDGEVSSVSFVLDVDSTYKAHLNQLDYSRCTEDFGYRFGLALGGGTSKYKYLPYFLVVQPISSTPDDIVYMELVSGSSTGLTAEWVESVVAFDRDSVDKPTLAVRTDVGITSYQIGGVRPSIPEKGQVWAMVENDRIVSIQIYNGQAWEGVDGRIWTGQRWIPASSYNIITLQDMYDIVDATPNYEYIYSEAGFWSWWQKSWNAFTEKLFAVLGSNGVGSGGVTLNPDTAPVVPDDEATGEKGYSILELLVVLKDGTWSIVRGVVSTAYDGFSGFVTTVSNAGSFFDSYSEDSEGSLVFIPLGEGETIWD